MKRQTLSAILMAIAMLAVVSCGPKSDLPGFTKTKSGLHYQFLEQNKSAQPVNEGDVLVGEMVVRFNQDTLFANIGNPGRILIAAPGQFDGDLPEGLTMMHVGDRAIFAVDADMFAKFAKAMPPTYASGQGDKFYYEIHLTDIVTAEELKAEQEAYMANMQDAEEAEPELIAQYVKEHNITSEPTQNGVYIVVNKKGNGPKVAAGKQVAMHYTGRLLDGTVFDSSEGREPLSYRVGEQPLLRGWEEGVMGQPAGTKLTLVIPSNMAYGERGAGDRIPPYSPLTFDIEIVSVS